MEHNCALNRMLNGQPAIGASAGLGAPLAAEALSLAGFDFVLIDHQHGNWNNDTTMQAIHSICLGAATPMARVQQNDYYAIGQLLDRGALGIVVPMVNSIQDAERAAFAARYPPRGGRSDGPFGVDVHGSEYSEWADDEIFLAVQIETKEAAQQAVGILNVDGINGCWIGPADLARSMDVDLASPQGKLAHEAAIQSILDACRTTGKIPGIAASTDAERRLEQGFLFVTAGSEMSFLRDRLTERLQQLRR